MGGCLWSFYREIQKDKKQHLYVLTLGSFQYCLYFHFVFDLLGVPWEEEEEEDEDTTWTGKLCALVHKIKGPPKPEKEPPTEEEERYPSK